MNFCARSLGTTVSTDQAEEDSYPVSNLIEHSNQLSNSLFLSSSSSVTNGNGNGFMTARFVRPPVKIKLEFQVPIEICHIVICPTVSKQTSSGFQIEAVITGKAKTPDEKYSLSTHTIAKEFLNAAVVPNVLVFKNPRFKLKPHYHSLPLRQFELYRNYPTAFGLKHTAFFACEKVKSLEITILKVCGSSIPSIGSLQVWGQPSVHCTKAERDALVKSWLEVVSSQKKISLCKRKLDLDHDQNEDSDTKRSKLVAEEGTTTISSIPDIPEEFLDPIMYEIMSQPLRLPCGIAVDSTTLEKYNLEEAKWGRHPNDPFTALPFASHNQPMPDTGLRLRIDGFLSQHTSDPRFYNLPRTLGTIPTSEKKLQQNGISSCNSAPTPVSEPASSSMNQELEKLFGATTKEFVPVHQAQPDKEDRLVKCIKCANTQEPERQQSSSQVFYISSCQHIFVCRPCLILIDKNELQICKCCKSEWKVKDLIRFHN